MKLHLLFALTMGLALFACDDTGGGGQTVILPGQGGAGGAGPGVIPVEPQGGGDAPGGGAPSAGAPPAGGSGGDDPPPPVGGQPTGECAPGELRCVEEGQAFRQLCREDRRWAVEPCAEGMTCVQGLCVDDGGDCQPGDVSCLPGEVPATCRDGGGWEPGAPCAADELCRVGQCVSRACAQAQSSQSYLGCDYLAVALPNSAFAAGGPTPTAPIGVVLANPDFTNPARVTVMGPNGQPAQLVPNRNIPIPPIDEIQGLYQPQTVRSEVRDGAGQVVAQDLAQAVELEVPPGGLATLLLPNGGASGPSSSVGRTAYRVSSNRPLAAYQFSPYCCNYSFSNDASLLFPTTALGTDYRFLGIPTWQSPLSPTHSPAAMVVVAAEDNTRVDIALPAAGLLLPDLGGGRVREANGRLSVTLAAQEVLTLKTRANALAFPAPPPADLSGARITTSKPAAVFSSHECTYYPELMGACDHVEEQLFPTGTWGNVFVLVPPVERGAGSDFELIYWKIIARDPGTRVQFSVPWAQLGARGPGFSGVPDCGRMRQGEDTVVLQGSDFCEFGTKSPVQITADGPIMVMGIVSGQESTGVLQAFGAHAGDPAIFLVPPDLQYRQDYAFLVPDTYVNDFVTIVTDPGASVLLDGADVPLADATAVPGSGRVFKHVSVSDGPHRLQSNRPFGILVFAFDDFVSYAFTGGLNLTKR